MMQDLYTFCVKKLIIIFLIYFFLQSSLLPVFARGGFFILDGGPVGGAGGITGGTAMLDWRDFEPTKGNYQWQLIEDRNARFAPWKAYWERNVCLQSHTPTWCDQNNRRADPQPVPAAALFSPSGTTMRFKLRVTDGAMPLWLFGGRGAKEDVLDGDSGNGTLPNLTGGKICGCTTYCYVAGQPECHGDEDIVHATTLPLYPEKEDNAHPVWWNLDFQQELRTTLLAIGERIESNPTLKSHIEFVEASVGNFGEMILYGNQETFWSYCDNAPNASLVINGHNVCTCHDDDVVNHRCNASQVGTNVFCTYSYKSNPQHFTDGVKKWLGAGYTNRKYYEAVMNILGFYVESFPGIPIALSTGTGLYPGPPKIYDVNCQPKDKDDEDYYYVMTRNVLGEAMSRWGSKMYLKFAGFPRGLAQGFREYCPHITRCVYESVGGITGWSGWPWYRSGTTISDHGILENIFISGANNGAYIIMMWDGDFDAINYNSDGINRTDLVNAFSHAAPYLFANGAISPTPPPPIPTATPTPGITLEFKKGWNTVSWLASLPNDKRPSSLSSECRLMSRDSSFWKPFVKTYGGDDGLFVADRRYPIWCRDTVSWPFN